MGNDLSFGHGFLSHFYPPVGMEYKSWIAGVYWKGNWDSSGKIQEIQIKDLLDILPFNFI